MLSEQQVQVSRAGQSHFHVRLSKIIFFSVLKAHNNAGSHQKLNYLAFATKEPFCFINLVPTLH